MITDLYRQEGLEIFINGVQGHCVEDSDLESSGEMLRVSCNHEGDIAKKADADCVTSVNCGILDDANHQVSCSKCKYEYVNCDKE
jgi:hypothetical protein